MLCVLVVHVSTTIKGILKINFFKKEKALLAINKNSLRHYFIDQKLRLEQVKVIDLMIIRPDGTQLTFRLNKVYLVLFHLNKN